MEDEMNPWNEVKQDKGEQGMEQHLHSTSSIAVLSCSVLSFEDLIVLELLQVSNE